MAVLLGWSATASAPPISQSLAPVATNFTFGIGNDFLVTTGTGLGDVTASLYAVDLVVPSPGGSTSGWEAADFAGFAAGTIALIQRGTCTFADKAANALAAGAVGGLIFNLQRLDTARIDATRSAYVLTVLTRPSAGRPPDITVMLLSAIQGDPL